MNLVLFESGVFQAEQVRQWVQGNLEEISTRPEALRRLHSTNPAEISRGLKLISDGILDWRSFGGISAVLLEEMVMGSLTLRQVVETLRLLDHKTQQGELTVRPNLVSVFVQDEFSFEMYPRRLDAIDDGTSNAFLVELQEDVDTSLSCYATL